MMDYRTPHWTEIEENKMNAAAAVRNYSGWTAEIPTDEQFIQAYAYGQLVAACFTEHDVYAAHYGFEIGCAVGERAEINSHGATEADCYYTYETVESGKVLFTTADRRALGFFISGYKLGMRTRRSTRKAAATSTAAQ